MAVSALASTDQYPACLHARIVIGSSSVQPLGRAHKQKSACRPPETALHSVSTAAASQHLLHPYGAHNAKYKLEVPGCLLCDDNPAGSMTACTIRLIIRCPGPARYAVVFQILLLTRKTGMPGEYVMRTLDCYSQTCSCSGSSHVSSFPVIHLLLLSASFNFFGMPSSCTQYHDAGAWWVNADLQTLGNGLLGFRHTAGRSAPAAAPTIGTPPSHVPGHQI